MNKLIFCLSVFVGITMTTQGIAQRFNGFGLVYKAGVTQSRDYDDSSNPFVQSALISSAAGLYKIINLHKDSVSRMISYLKVDLHPFSYRKGYFEVNGNPVMITSHFIDLDIIIPTRFKLSASLDAYVGVGPSVNFLIKQDIKQSGTNEEIENQQVQYGIVGEMGIITKGSTNFGIRTFGGFSDYPLTEISVFFGIGFPDFYNSRKHK